MGTGLDPCLRRDDERGRNGEKGLDPCFHRDDKRGRNDGREIRGRAIL